MGLELEVVALAAFAVGGGERHHLILKVDVVDGFNREVGNRAPVLVDHVSATPVDAEEDAETFELDNERLFNLDNTRKNSNY